MIETVSSQKFGRMERNGRLLCSPRNPVKEAQDWIQRQKLSSEDQRVLVLGFGAGFHISELQKRFPNLQIEIFEMDPEFRNSEFHFVNELHAEEYDAILAFRPSWAGFEAEYLQHYLSLTGRDQNPELQFQQNQDELKIWQSLRELIK